MNKIYTKKGDGGKSSLPGGAKISKASSVFAVLGQIDQTNACIGLLLSEEIAEYGRDLLLDIQRHLMAIGSVVAGVEVDDIRTMVTARDISNLESEIDTMTDELPELSNFILPGGSRRAALAHLVRSEVRTLERRITGLPLTHAESIIWINRLSDFFFTLARYFNYLDNQEEIAWN